MTEKKSEAKTRVELIDPKLRLAGWDLSDPSQVTEELDIDLVKAGVMKATEATTPYGGHQFSDYGLLLKGKYAAVIEAKKT